MDLLRKPCRGSKLLDMQSVRKIVFSKMSMKYRLKQPLSFAYRIANCGASGIPPRRHECLCSLWLLRYDRIQKTVFLMIRILSAARHMITIAFEKLNSTNGTSNLLLTKMSGQCQTFPYTKNESAPPTLRELANNPKTLWEAHRAQLPLFVSESNLEHRLAG